MYYEPVIDNVYLEDFYKDMSKYAFSMQVGRLHLCAPGRCTRITLGAAHGRSTC